METDPMKVVETRLEEELGREQASSKRTLYGGAAGLVIWACYLGWGSSSVATILDEEALAGAAAGYVVEQVPVVGDHLRDTLVLHADDVVKEGAAAVLARVPTMRQELEAELYPTIDKAAAELASAAVEALVEAGKHPETTVAIDGGTVAVAHAAVKQLPEALEGAMDLPMEDGRTPRQAIADSLDVLVAADANLAEIASGKSGAMERELVVAWVDMLEDAGLEQIEPGDVHDGLE